MRGAMRKRRQMVYEIDFTSGVLSGLLGRFLFARKPVVRINGREYKGDEGLRIVKAGVSGQVGIVVVHGYNSKNVDPAYAEIVSNMGKEGHLLYNPYVATAPYAFILLVKWPGGWKGGYWAAEARAYGFLGMDGAGQRLHDFLQALPAAALDIMGHSLGCGVVLKCLSALDTGIRNCFLVAAAVDNESVCVGGRWVDGVVGLQGFCACYVGENDGALLAYNFAKFDRALGKCGPDGKRPENLVVVESTDWSEGHSDFRRRWQFYKSMLHLLENYNRPLRMTAGAE